MASQVNVNALTVVHAGSDGIAPAFPDVCLTPSPAGPPIPVPYPNLAQSADTAQGTKSVIVEGNPVMVQDAVFATSTGDEAGSAGGVASATTKGKARFVNYSFDVKLEGRCVARLGDPMTHNELAAANTAPFPEVQPPCSMAPSIADGDDAVEIAQVAATPASVFVWDRVSERQWVNLPAAWGPDCGRQVTLVGHVEPRAAGRKVTFRLLPDAANPTRHARAELASVTARSEADGAVKLDVVLPIYGGAGFQVSARTVNGPSVLSPPITVWRRIYYQLTTMEPAPDGRRFDVPPGLMDALRERLAAVFIDLQPGTVASGTTPYMENVGTNPEYVAITKAARKDDRSPLKLHIVAIDNSESLVMQNKKLYASAQVETKPFPRWKYGPTIKSATFTTHEEPDDPKPLEDVQVLELMDGKAIITARVPHPHPWKVMVRLKYRMAGPTPIGRGGTGGVLRICVGYMREHYAPQEILPLLCHVMLHEIGHAFGLVPKTKSWADPDPRDRSYEVIHCGHLAGDGSPECVMWFKARHGGIGHYCTSHEPLNCAHFVRAMDLSKVKWI